MRLDDLFQNLGLGLPYLFGPRHSRCPEIWDPVLKPHWSGLRMEMPRFAGSRSKGLCALTTLWGAEGLMPEAECPQF